MTSTDHANPERSSPGWRPVVVRMIGFGLMIWAVVGAMRWTTLIHPLQFGLVAVAPGMIVAALLAIAILGHGGRRVASILLALALIWVAVPGGLVPRLRCPAPRPGEASLSLLTHNVLWSPALKPRRVEEVADQIAEANPDVVVLQEAESDFVDGLTTILGDRYPHVVSAAAQDTQSLALLSRWSLTAVVDTTTVDPDGPNPMLIATVRTPQGAVRLANVHLTAPVTGERIDRRRLEIDLLRSGPVAVDGAQVVAGDFNAGTAHRDFRHLLASGWTTAHAQVGCGIGNSWSPLQRGPGLMGIDHVLTANGASTPDRTVVPVAHRLEGYAGSDHRAVLVHLRIEPSS